MLDANHWLLFVVALPFCLYATWSDLKYMRIPNWLCLGLAGVFLAFGLYYLTLAELGWQFLAGLIVLIITFGLNAMGKMGGGDAKLLAALAPFIAFERAQDFFLIFAVCQIASLVIHRSARAMPPVRRATPDWVSWDSSHFPMGTGISASLAIYLLMMALDLLPLAKMFAPS